MSQSINSAFLIKSFFILTLLISVLASCSINSDDRTGGLFATEAIMEGVVYEQDGETLVEDASVYISNWDLRVCSDESNIDMSIKADSTNTSASGMYQLSVISGNLEGPICLETYASYSNSGQELVSDTLRVELELKEAEPYDVTVVDFILN